MGLFFERPILARKWLAKMTKTRQNENENFQTMANRDDSSLRRCGACDPTHSSELRLASWLTFDAAFGAGWPTCTPGAARARVSLESIAESPEKKRCGHLSAKEMCVSFIATGPVTG